MKPRGSFSALVRARLFELIDRFGRFAARLGAGSSDPNDRVLTLIPTTSVENGGDPATTVADPTLTWSGSAGSSRVLLDLPPVGAGADTRQISATLDLARATTSSYGILQALHGPSTRYARVKVEADGTLGTGYAAHVEGGGELHLRNASGESAIRYRDSSSGTSPHKLEGYRLGAQARGIVGYGWCQAGTIDVGPGFGSFPMFSGGLGGSYSAAPDVDGFNGAGFGIPVELIASRYYRITMSVRATQLVAGAGETPIAIRLFFNGGVWAVGQMHRILNAGQYDGIHAEWLLPGNVAGAFYFAADVVNLSGGNTIRLYCDGWQTFLMIEDLGAVRYRSGHTSGSTGPAPFVGRSSWQGPWDDETA